MDNNKAPKPHFNFMWIYLGIAFLLGFLVIRSGGPSLLSSSNKEVTYSEFKTYVSKGYASRIVANKRDGSLCMYVSPEHVRDVFPTSSVQPGTEVFVEAEFPSADKLDSFLEQQQEAGNFKGEVSYEQGDDMFRNILWSFGPLVLIIFFWMFMLRGAGGGGGGGGAMGLFNVGKSRAKLVEKDQRAKVTFKDVAGLYGAKDEVMEIVDFLKNPKKYTALGGKIPKGALLVGPPGTGKTLLAKAVAGEANVPFFSISGSDFVEMFVGVGASRVRDLFRQAKEKAPCIVFIDEIDAVGRARGKNAGFSSNDERENTLNQLLTEMDGFDTNSGVIVLAATNRADILDKALMRAGRFDRQIHVDLPELKERVEIFNVHIKGLKIAGDFDVEFMAKHTPGFSGADIANVCNEAALTAARRDKKEIDRQDFLDAVDRIIGGLERKAAIITPAEKKSIAHHEAGHAAVSWLLPYANPLFKVTLIPRGQALGAAWYLPEERKLWTKSQMIDEMCSLIGGRVAEEIVNGEPSTGAQNDLERLTQMAYGMVKYYGMSEAVGALSFYDSTGARGYDLTKPFSEKTAEVIDAEVKNIVPMIHDRTLKILTDNKEGFLKMAALLLEKEVIFADDVEKILGPKVKPEADELTPEDTADEPSDKASADTN